MVPIPHFCEKSARFIWFTQPGTDLPIRTSGCLLCFPSFTWSIMTVYRITVLSFTRSALICDRWLAFAFNITQNSFPKRRDFFPPSDESTPDMRQSRKQTFFSVAVLTTVKCDLFKTRYMFLRGGRGELRTVLKGNMSGGCQPPPISWYVFFLSHTRKFFLWLFPTLDFIKTNSHKRSEQPCGRHMLEMGWFKLINLLWDLFVLQDVWTHLVQWACAAIAIWWNPSVSRLLIVLSVQSHSCQASKSGKRYL